MPAGRRCRPEPSGPHRQTRCSTAPIGICIAQRRKNPVRNKAHPKKQDPWVLSVRHSVYAALVAVVAVVMVVVVMMMMMTAGSHNDARHNPAIAVMMMVVVV